MYVSHSITIDVTSPRKQVLHVVQDDSTRILELTLMANGLGYNVAADLDGEAYTGAVSCEKPDGTRCVYDTRRAPLYDSSATYPANSYVTHDDLVYHNPSEINTPEEWTAAHWSLGGQAAVALKNGYTNVFTCYLDGQCFTAAGEAQINVLFYTESGKQLCTYEIMVDVRPNASSGAGSTSFEQLMSIADLRVAMQTVEEELSETTDVVDAISEKIYTTYANMARATGSDSSLNYWYIPTSARQLVAGYTYFLIFHPTASFTCADVKMGTGASFQSMVDLVADSITFTANEETIVTYTPTQDDLSFLRVAGHAADFTAIEVATVSVTPKGLPAVEEELSDTADDVDAMKNESAVAVRVNKAIFELRKLKNEVDSNVQSLLGVQLSEGTSQTVTLPSVGVHGRCLVRLGLHYESEKYTPQADDVFFDKACRKDFSDVRFFDVNGKMIPAIMGETVNCDILADQNINRLLKTTSQGYIIGFDSSRGIVVSRDNGATYTAIANTYNVTEHGSDVYNRKSMYPVFVDRNDNIYAYAEGILNKLFASDEYATIHPVLDFSWVNGEGQTVYPEIQNHGMDEDTNGNLIMGTYAGTGYFHTDIFASTDGGDTWSLVWHNYGGEYQHIHHVHADPLTSAVYVGVDDSGGYYSGGRVLKTTDGGATWEDLSARIVETRGKDYFPTYFGDGYFLGGGESYVMGGGTVYRSTDFVHLDTPVEGFAGVRSFADFGDDSMIFCGSSSSTLVAENHIFVSTDKGKTWRSVYKKFQAPNTFSGVGYRDAHNAIQLAGDSEPCIMLPKDQGNVPSVRIYKGGDHFFREAYLVLENTTNDPITITVKTGYFMGYPNKTVPERTNEHLVFQLPLNEGIGKVVTDSRGNTHQITGTGYQWSTNEAVRHGDYAGESTVFPLTPSSGIRLAQGTLLDCGKISGLDFSGNYTITFWLNTDGYSFEQDLWNNKAHAVVNLFDIGNIKAAIRSTAMVLLDNTVDIPASMDSIATVPHMGQNLRSTGFKFTKSFVFVAISVASDGTCKVYMNGSEGSTQNSYHADINEWIDLSQGNLVIGSVDYPSAGYLADFRIYSTALSEEEILNLYRGF